MTERTLCIFKPDLAANLHNTTQALTRVLTLKLVPVDLRRLWMRDEGEVPVHFVIVNGTGTVDEVHERMWDAICSVLAIS